MRLLAFASLLRLLVLMGGVFMMAEESCGADEPVEKSRLDLFLEAALEQLRGPAPPDPPPLVKNGVDAAYVDYLEEVAEKTGLGLPCCETDGDGRIVAVSVTAFDANDQPLDEVLRRIAPLRHVKSAKIQEWMDLEVELPQPLSDDDLELLAGWTQLESLVIRGRSLSGRAFERLTRRNALPRLQELEIGLAEDAADVDLIPAAFAGCQALRKFELRRVHLTDAGLASLGQLTNLETIDFSGTEITGEGLRHFGKLTNLETINVSGTKITATGLRHLAPLQKLRAVHLEDVPNDDEGLRHLSQLPRLKKLYTQGREITDDGLAFLANLTDLETLSVSDSGITAHGLEHLAKLPRLTSLRIDETRVGDEAVATLRRMTQLKHFAASDTELTVAGIEQLRAALPNCNVVCYEPKPNQPAGK